MRAGDVMKRPLCPRLAVLVSCLHTPCLTCTACVVCWTEDSPRAPSEFSGQRVRSITGRWIAFVRLLELITVQGCLPLNEMKC